MYAEKLVSDGPSLKRSADQLDDASRLLLTKVSVKSSNVEAEATRFLGMHGYNCTRLQRARNGVQLAGGGDEVLERLAEADVDGYLRHQRRVILLTAIEEAKGGTLDAARNQAARAMEADWASARAQLVANLNGAREVDVTAVWDDQQLSGAAQASASFSRHSAANVTVHRPTGRELLLQETVTAWTAAQRKGTAAETLASFVARSAPDEAGCWALVAAQQKKGAAASVAHLEQQMRAVVLGSVGGVSLGGSQALTPAVLHYVQQVRGWNSPLAVVWTLLRCGAASEAAAFARQRIGDGVLADAIERGGGSSWPHPASNTRPDWGAALSVALGAAVNENLARESGAYSTTEDYLWLRLRVKPDLPALQAVLRKNSSAFSGRPALQMLLHLLVQDNEAALSTALSSPQHALHIEALHLALALNVGAVVPSLATYLLRFSPNLMADYCMAGGVALATRLLMANSALLPLLPQAVPDASARQSVLETTGRSLSRSGRSLEASRLLEAAGLSQEAANEHCQLVARAIARGVPDLATVQSARALAARLPASQKRSLEVLLAASDFVSLVAAGNVSAALSSCDDGPLQSLFPATAADAHKCVDEIDSLGGASLIVPPLFLAYAGALSRLHSVRPSPMLKTRMQLLVALAGMLQNRIASDVFARLIAMSSSMV